MIDTLIIPRKKRPQADSIRPVTVRIIIFMKGFHPPFLHYNVGNSVGFPEQYGGNLMRKFTLSMRLITACTFIVGIICTFIGPKTVPTHFNGLGTIDATSGPLAFLAEGGIVVIFGELVILWAKWRRKKDATSDINMIMYKELYMIFFTGIIAVVALINMWQQMHGIAG